MKSLMKPELIKFTPLSLNLKNEFGISGIN
jgi:hypothetical protein